MFDLNTVNQVLFWYLIMHVLIIFCTKCVLNNIKLLIKLHLYLNLILTLASIEMLKQLPE